VGAISFVIGDLVLEVYAGANLAVLGMITLGGEILGLGLDSAAVGLGSRSSWPWCTWRSIAAQDTCSRSAFPEKKKGSSIRPNHGL
jgi:hypothetical protein